jgi:hypothetical protein
MREVIDVRNIQEICELEPSLKLSGLKEDSHAEPVTHIEVEKQNSEEKQSTKEPKIIEKMKSKFDTAIEYSSNNKKIQRGDDDFYKYCGIAIRKLIKDLSLPNRSVLELLVEHLVDMLDSKEKLELLNYLYLNQVEENSFEDMIQKYLMKKIVRTRRLLGFLTFKKDKNLLFIWNDSKKKWVPADPEDEIEINKALSEKFIFKKDEYSDLVGFIGQDQKNTYSIFKIKDTKAIRNTGARCDEAGKMKKLEVLNSILGEEKYNKDNTKGMGQAEICTIIEFILRYNNNLKKDGKIWFLTIELSALNKFL